ncbi:MAG: flippase-like domain-containing protein [Nanoarchaeota archaeon]|nr:flippase-like domain-containing protein [Nanoarchaeota archaeon]
MKKEIFFGASFLIGLILFISVLGGIGLNTIINIFRSINWIYAGLFLLVSILILLAKTYKWHYILRAHNVKINFLRLFMCKLSGIAISFITPIAFMGGGVAMGYLLSKEKVKSHTAVSSVVLDKSFEIVTSLLFTLVGGVLIITHFAVSQNTIVLLMLMPLILFGIFYFLYDKIRKRKGVITSVIKILKLDKVKWLKKYNKVIKKSEKNVENFLLKNKKESIKTLLMTFFAWSLMFLEYKFALLAIGYDLNVAVLFAAITVVGLTYSLPIPAALGALEGGQASLFSAIRVGAGVGFALGLVIRMRDLLWTFIGLTYFAIRGLNLNKKSALDDKI